ncbi:MAG: hypothetical protein AB7F89_11285 [Pirellulaceae bacterium]
MMDTCRRLGLTSLLLLAAMSVTCSTASAQWRGRYVHRSGLFRDVERLHWGGGITPAGASVLTTGITQFAPIVGALVGREEPADRGESADREARGRSDWCEKYAEQQRLANELLARTADLVRRVGGEPQPAESISPGLTPSGAGTPAGSEFGSNPWEAHP